MRSPTRRGSTRWTWTPLCRRRRLRATTTTTCLQACRFRRAPLATSPSTSPSSGWRGTWRWMAASAAAPHSAMTAMAQRSRRRSRGSASTTTSKSSRRRLSPPALSALVDLPCPRYRRRRRTRRRWKWSGCVQWSMARHLSASALEEQCRPTCWSFPSGRSPNLISSRHASTRATCSWTKASPPPSSMSLTLSAAPHWTTPLLQSGHAMPTKARRRGGPSARWCLMPSSRSPLRR
mmetsp:Transcript_22567/g.72976  ORF Transcript_22567/g.72976 Transcript_22567/m.72976 type:complete len:235 (-) Transcript_22567:1313-2017(-)